MSWHGSKKSCGCCGMNYRIARVQVRDRRTGEETRIWLCENCQQKPQRAVWLKYART
jgi:hypothetical protein